jgi:hypothetical protein
LAVLEVGKADGAGMANEDMKNFLPEEERAPRIISAVTVGLRAGESQYGPSSVRMV